MCGLPGCGKTYWANKYVTEHSDKMFNILGTNALIDKMKVQISSIIISTFKVIILIIVELIELINAKIWSRAADNQMCYSTVCR